MSRLVSSFPSNDQFYREKLIMILNDCGTVLSTWIIAISRFTWIESKGGIFIICHNWLLERNQDFLLVQNIELGWERTRKNLNLRFWPPEIPILLSMRGWFISCWRKRTCLTCNSTNFLIVRIELFRRICGLIFCFSRRTWNFMCSHSRFAFWGQFQPDWRAIN